MRIVSLLLTLVCVMSFNLTHAKIGYFWHITDFHYDPLYTAQGDTRRHCRRADERGSSGHHRALGRLGDYSCDSSLELIQSALRYMRTRHSENVEFVLWTGDIVAVQYSENEDNRYQAIRNITELLRMTFSSHFVFPVLGHTDPAPSESLTNLWKHWLPMEALQTLKLYGYYTIEQSHSKLRIVALNTNLFSHSQANSLLGRRQWEWLEAVLDKATANNEMVYIVGHAAPGSDSRYNAYSVDANAKFLNIVRRHARIIAGQFFGHLHVDTFRVIYDKELPVSWAFLAPSLSPHHDPAGSSNPGLRLYKFDSDTGKVLDYTQFYLDLAVANRAGASGSAIVGSDWVPEYNLTQYYGLRDVSAESLHHLADKLRIGTAHELTMFNKYLRAYNVKHDSSDNCDGACAHQHYCAITCLEHIAYRQCVEAAASALAASGRSASLVAPLINVTITLIIVLDYTQFYLDLAVANRAGASGSAIVGSDWVPEYNLTQYYGLRDVSAESLHHLADKLRIGTAHELTMFNKYLRAYNVKHDSSDNCDGACAHQHYCAITCLEHIAYRQCVEAAASALAASGRSASLVAPLINVTITLIIVCIAVL